MKIEMKLLFVVLSILLISCNKRDKYNLTKEDYANDIGKYVKLSKEFKENSYSEIPLGYKLYNGTDYTIDKVVVEYVIFKEIVQTWETINSSHHTVSVELDYIGAKERRKMLNEEIFRSLNNDERELKLSNKKLRFTIKSAKIKSIKSKALNL